jgi:hypothetical protein
MGPWGSFSSGCKNIAFAEAAVSTVSLGKMPQAAYTGSPRRSLSHVKGWQFWSVYDCILPRVHVWHSVADFILTEVSKMGQSLEPVVSVHSKSTQLSLLLYALRSNAGGKGDKGEQRRGWYIWYIVRTFVNATMYRHLAQQQKQQQKKKKEKRSNTIQIHVL